MATPGSAVWTIDDVVRALQEQGLTVESTGQMVRHDFFTVPAMIIRVNGQDLQVLIYPSEAARTSDSEQISDDGAQVGTSMITWVAKPHFVAAGNVLTLFVSNDEVLARQIAAAVMTLAPSEISSPIASPAAPS
jgi:hypothetical protein